MIIKTKINKDTINLSYLHIFLQTFIKKNKYIGNICLDYKNNIRIDNNLIPFLFCNKIIFKYYCTFQQNNKLLSNKIRKTVLSLCNNITELTCIGGESLIYPILLNLTYYNFYSDSIKLVDESLFNSTIYKIKNNSTVINYNICNNINCCENLILNLDTLNYNLLKIINIKNIKNIIIINCNHKDFWKKMKYLTNFKIKKRYKFISKNYFITVTLLN